MASLFQLAGSIFIDNEAANSSLAKTESKAESVGKSLLNGAKKAGKFAVGVTTAATGAVTAMTAMAKDTAASMDTVDKASQRMKISAESYQTLGHAAELCGVDMGTLEKASKKLEGTGLNLDDALEQIYSLEDAEARAALASDLFGDSIAYNLTPMLNASGESFNAMRQEAYDMGLVMSNDTVSAGAALNDALTNVNSMLSALGNEVGAALMPVVMEMCNFITENMPTIQAMFDQIAPVLVDMFEKLMPQIMSLAETLLPVLVDLFNTLLPLFVSICENVLPVIVELIAALLPPIIKIVQALLPVAVELINALLPILTPLVSLLEPILDLTLALLSPLLELINIIIPPLTELITGIVEVVKDSLVPTIKDFIGNFVDRIGNAFAKVKSHLTSLKDKFTDIFGKIKDGIKSPINGIIGFLNSLVGGVVKTVNKVISAMNSLSFDVPDWVPGIGGSKFGFDIKEMTYSEIPLLAKGAVIEPNNPMLAVVGDQKQGTNIEAPLDTIKQAVAEVLAEMTLNVNVSASPDTARWFSAMQAEGRAFTNRTGLPSMG